MLRWGVSFGWGCNMLFKRLIGQIVLNAMLWLISLSALADENVAETSCLTLPDTIAKEALRTVYQQPIQCWPKPKLDESVTDWQELGLLPEPPYPSDNPYSDAKMELGKTLFFDPRLSSSKQIACASCHDPELGWGDGRSVAIGHDRKAGKRNTPTLLNSAYLKDVFWDGRAPSLEAQALMSMTNPIEMNANLVDVVRWINTQPGYKELFKQVWKVDQITTDEIAASIATFVRTVRSRPSAFDYWLRGDHRRMTDNQLEGLHLFRTKAGCMNCHNGPLFTDGKFHNIGFHFYGRALEDRGRYNVTKKPEDMSAFRTTGLRDVAFTGPWLHNGWATEMMALMRFYNVGGPRPENRTKDPLFPKTSPLLKRLNLSEEEMQRLIDFMHSISYRPMRVAAPKLP